MKFNWLKKAAALALAAAVMVTAAPVQAAPYVPEKATVYMTSTDGTGGSTQSIYIGSLTKTQTITKSSVKTSNSKVVGLYSLHQYSSSSKTDYFVANQQPYNSNNYYYNISLEPKKAGTAKISFTLKGVGQQTVDVTVKKYENPVGSLKVSGISGELKSKTAKGTFVNDLKLTKTTNNATIQVKSAANWKIRQVSFEDVENSRYIYTYSYSKLMSSATLRVGTLTAGKQYRVSIDCYNPTDGGQLNCIYYINDQTN